MPRIDTSNPHERWGYACPRDRHRDWRCIDGHFQCRSCDQAYLYLVDLQTGERIHRDEFEFIGREAAKEQFSEPV